MAAYDIPPISKKFASLPILRAVRQNIQRAEICLFDLCQRPIPSTPFIISFLALSPAEKKDIDSLINQAAHILRGIGYSNFSVLVREGDVKNKSIAHVHYHIIPNDRIGDLDHRDAIEECSVRLPFRRPSPLSSKRYKKACQERRIVKRVKMWVHNP